MRQAEQPLEDATGDRRIEDAAVLVTAYQVVTLSRLMVLQNVLAGLPRSAQRSMRAKRLSVRGR